MAAGCDATPFSVLAAMRESALAFPERTAHQSPTGAVTYRALLAATGRLAATLASGRTGPVMVYGHKENAMVTGFLAALFAGRPYVPVDVAVPAARILRIAAIAEVQTVLEARPLPDAVRAGLDDRGVRFVPVPDALDGIPPLPATTPDDLAYIIFTSGSTGDPKGVPIPLRGLSHFTHWMRQRAHLGAGTEVVLNQAPFSFDLSVMDLYLSLTTGGTLFSVTAEQIARPRDLFSALYGAGLTVWVSTPSFVRFCLADPGFSQRRLPLLSRFLFCGETLPAKTALELLRRFPEAEVWNTYGPTECTVAVSSVRIDRDLAAGEVLPVGEAAPGMRIWIIGPDQRPLGPGAMGEIVIAGPQVSPGYRRSPDDAGAPSGFGMLPDPDGEGTVFAYRTGDSGYLRDGMLYCAGRMDRQIKLRGYRLELDEIEERLRTLAGVSDAAVLPVMDDGSPEYLVAFVAGDSDSPEPAEDLDRARQLRSQLAEQLPAYALPRAFRFMAQLPLTANGKVDRRRLAGWGR